MKFGITYYTIPKIFGMSESCYIGVTKRGDSNMANLQKFARDRFSLKGLKERSESLEREKKSKRNRDRGMSR